MLVVLFHPVLLNCKFFMALLSELPMETHSIDKIMWTSAFTVFKMADDGHTQMTSIRKSL